MNQEIVRPALGQIARVGTFYDARTDSFLSRSLIKDDVSRSSVSRQATRTTSMEIGFQDGFSEKFKKLKISADLGASIVSGFVPLEGPGRYISEKVEDAPQLQAAIYHTVTTVQDKLELTSPALRSSVALPSLHIRDATHVLVEVHYGAQTIIVASRWLREDESKEDVEPHFRVSMGQFKRSLQDPYSMPSDRPANSFEQVLAYCSTLGNKELVLSGLQEARAFINLVPAQIQSTEHGEGFPIMYRLIPIKTLELFGLLRVEGSEVTTAASPDCLKKFFNLFEEFHACRSTLQERNNYFSKHKHYLDPQHLRDIARRLNDTSLAESDLKRELGQVLRRVREGSGDPDDLWQLLSKFSQGESSPTALASVAESNQQKLAFIDQMTMQGAVYFGHQNLNWKDSLKRSRTQDAYVLFFNEASMQDKATWNKNQDVFVKCLQASSDDALVVMVDCDATGHNVSRALVSHYQAGEEVVQDLLEEEEYLSEHCFARYSANSLDKTDVKRPLDRRLVKIACPNQNCDPGVACEWRCSACDAPLEYGFSDQYIYCDCGRVLYDAYEFKCNHDRHGTGYSRYEKQDLLASLSSLDQSNYLNILILGETGVGKSTFINAFVNYLYFSSLDDALQNEELNWIIPCSFATQTMDRSNPGSPIIENKIKVGNKSHEHDGSDGKSATQETQVYPITTGSMTYRLIDTPGIGDTRGLEYDKKNMNDILTTVSGYDYLHGIVILLRSNNARLTVHFQFCIKELLTHLHRDATHNVVFGFTNTRISNYMPGDTYGSLKKLLSDRPDIGLSLASNSAYCFDSESFRYLAAAKNGVIMDNKRDFVSSWDRSSEEAHRMLDYFATKRPHAVKSTTSLNGTRNLIKELTKPMADISGVIQTNMDVMKDDIQDLQDARLTGDQLRTKLHPEKTLLQKVDLDQPKTVCSDKACHEAHDDGTGTGTMLLAYPQPCHDGCHLGNVPVDTMNCPSLVHCWAFSGSENCQRCGHHWTQHLHIMYELETYTTTIKDLGIEQQLKNHADELQLKQSAIQNRKDLIEEYRKEHDELQMAAAKFGLFMKDNSILPYNDATIAYLDMMIEAEEAKVDAGGGKKNKDTLQNLRQHKSRHNELVDVLEKSMQQGGTASAITQDEVNDIVHRLFNLKHFGQSLENLQTNIAYTHARTNRENPHRVRARHGARRATYGSSRNNHRSNQPIRMPASNGKQGRPGSVLMKPGISSGTMRVGGYKSASDNMPGAFNGVSGQLPMHGKQPPQKPPKKSTVMSWFRR